MTADGDPPLPKRSCLLKGCLVALACGVGGLGLLLLMGFLLFKRIQSYTSETPLAIPSLAEGAAGFDPSAKEPSVDDHGDLRIEFTAEELNLLLAEKMRESPARLRIRIEQDVLLADLTLPVAVVLEKLPIKRLPGFAGRHLNGTIGLTPAIEKGRVRLALQNITLNHRPLNRRWFPAIEKQLEARLNAGLQTNALLQGYLLFVKNLEIKGNRLVIHVVNMGGGEGS